MEVDGCEQALVTNTTSPQAIQHEPLLFWPHEDPFADLYPGEVFDLPDDVHQSDCVPPVAADYFLGKINADTGSQDMPQFTGSPPLKAPVGTSTSTGATAPKRGQRHDSVVSPNEDDANPEPPLAPELAWQPDVPDYETSCGILFHTRLLLPPSCTETTETLDAKLPLSARQDWAKRFYTAFVRTDLTHDNIHGHRLKNLARQLAANPQEVRAWCWQIVSWALDFHVAGWCLPLSMAEGKHRPELDLSVHDRLAAIETVLAASKLVCKDIVDDGISAIQRLVARPNALLRYKKQCKKANDWRGKRADELREQARRFQKLQAGRGPILGPHAGPKLSLREGSGGPDSCADVAGMATLDIMDAD